MGEIEQVVSELRIQGWEVSLKSDARSWRAIPPNRTGRMVVFAREPKSLVAILRDLRQQGFVWPPNSNGGTLHPIEPKISATPFPPKPHPEARTEPQPKLDLAMADEQPGDDSEALAFLRLREAKEYERLAAVDLMQCTKELETIKHKVAGAERAYQDALRDLQKAKSDFDRAFERESAGHVSH